MFNRVLGVAMLLLAPIILLGIIFQIGHWWFVIDLFVVAVNIAGGVVLLRSNIILKWNGCG